MGFLDTREKRKSFIITSILMSVLLLVFTFVTVLKELDPPPESGIAVNFGNTAVGSGPVEPAKPTKVTPVTQTSQPQPAQSSEENIATQEIEDAPVINSSPDVETSTKPVKTDPKPQTEPVKEDPKPSSDVLNAIGSVTGADEIDGENNNGEGPGDGPGNKGQLNGDPYANAFDGDPGAGGKGFLLNGRSRLGYSPVLPICDEEGKVVVQITVNRQGEVVKAVPGKRGTSNKIQCLLDAAKKTAESYKFSPAPDARNELQIGLVEVIFKLGE
ncbi:ferric siderophore transport system [Nonlabens tegetincola]|uniref:Ferric siderophore transport system n=1 Tax=Nonlabens tegetincola TaxID=323273 RepID=A0A090Q8I9_9FLAO|nr:hypothetical protein [Nonlabens tegetincola]GAK98068.1 ferric siderophore transport system [Nonlabens tegetincola]